MTNEQYAFLDKFRQDFKNQIKIWNTFLPDLMDLQKQAAKIADTPDYPFQTPIVYNTALDDISPQDDIFKIVIGDNPGKDEQLLKNNKYLVGQAGKLGERFFKMNPELGTDFRKNVIILNKTPVHSAKTAQLKTIAKLGGTSAVQLIQQSQIWMAQKTVELAKTLNAQIWLVGYSELKPKGIFSLYRDELKKSDYLDSIFVYQHFSMNRFTIDLANYRKANSTQTLSEALTNLGTLHREEIFGI